MYVPDGGRFTIHALLVFTLSAIPRLSTSPACSALSESLCSFQKCLSSSEAATVAVALMWVRETAVSLHLSAFMAPWRLTLSLCLLNWDWSQQGVQHVVHTHTHTLEKLCLFWQWHRGCSGGATRLVWCDRRSHLFRLLFFLDVRVDVQPEPNVCVLWAEDLLGRAAAPDVRLNHQLKSYGLGMINTPISCGTLDHSNPPAVPASNPTACFCLNNT